MTAAQGHLLWSRGYDAPYVGTFEVMEAMGHDIANQIFRHVLGHSAERIQHCPASQLAPWELSVRGMASLWQLNQQRNRSARELFVTAVKQEPRQRLALYGLSLTHQRDVSELWVQDTQAAVATLAEVTGQHLAHFPDDPWALTMSSYASVYQGERAIALDYIQRALSLEPSSLHGLSLHGQLLAMDGQSDLAVEQITKALALSPRSPDRWAFEVVMGLSYFSGDSYQAAAEWGRKALRSRPASSLAAGLVASSLFHLGERVDARRAGQEFKQLLPTFTSDRFGPMLASTRKDIAERYAMGLAGALEAKKSK